MARPGRTHRAFVKRRPSTSSRFTFDHCCLSYPQLDRIIVLNIRDFRVKDPRPGLPSRLHCPVYSIPPARRDASSAVKDLLDRPPPARLPSFRAHGARNHALLEPICHPPPLAHLWIRRHELLVARPIIPDVLEGREQDTRLLVVEDAVCAHE